MNGQPSPGGSFDVHKDEEHLTSEPPLLGDSLKYKRRMITGKYYLQRRKAKRSTRILLAGTYTKLWRGLLGAVLVFPTEDIVSKCVTQCNPLESQGRAEPPPLGSLLPLRNEGEERDANHST